MDSNFKKHEVLAERIIQNAPRIHQRTLNVNILAFADTHYDFTKREKIERIYDEFYQSTDIVVLLGDHNAYFIDLLLQYFPDDIIFPLLGNHDDKTLFRMFGLKELHADAVKIKNKNITIGGISGSHKYKSNQHDRYLLLTQEESLKVCDKLLEEPPVDILLTHDVAYRENVNDIAHCGLIGITRYIFTEPNDCSHSNKLKTGPIIHMHGHLHKSYCRFYPNGTKEISVFGVEFLKL